MQAFTQEVGLAVVLDNANIDTDQIIPKQFLSKVTREGFGVHLFHDWRYLDDAGLEPNPEFALNQDRYKGASILIAGENFGCGSSREHAPWALADFGLRAIIAPSFADIFYGNALNIGLLPVVLASEDIAKLVADVDAVAGTLVSIDLAAQTVTSPTGKVFLFDIDAPAKQRLLKGLDAIGLTLEHQQAISHFEAQIPAHYR
ncbi:3-isopropylmalate dehydratase small subunit [Shewanella sp. NIFS-20-20]|uniref:3-isopropylmalate dehydratase small subunit n=1 Tax=Shewanella sp. NIFS-20-20 TaxID=2853806 RepID=UPI001C48CB1B|nr:3-isopropylmalate dehydratase small subunit [Shewanella sp. NIFS-20-20]MBV7315738.1 3-isopropylmalate dehydratase small subunit [Shewanella sp. NIFS-20-20]